MIVNVHLIIFTRSVLLCYLLVSSLAAVHASPVMEYPSHSNNAFMILDDAGLAGSSADSKTEAKGCHQNIEAAGSDSSALCKIFCSVMGVAISVPFVNDVAAFAYTVETAELANRFVSVQLSVEQHPPH